MILTHLAFFSFLAGAGGTVVAASLIGRKSRHYKRPLYDWSEYSPESIAGDPAVLAGLVTDVREIQAGALLLRPFEKAGRVDIAVLAEQLGVIKELRKVYFREMEERDIEDELLLL